VSEQNLDAVLQVQQLRAMLQGEAFLRLASRRRRNLLAGGRPSAQFLGHAVGSLFQVSILHRQINI
jgi:hypothetical protein